MRLRTCAGGVLAGAVLALALPVAASAGNPPKFTPAAAQKVSAGGSNGAKDDHWYIAKGSSCIIGKAIPGTYAKVSFLMHAGPYAATKVSNFIIHARMIPHGQNAPGQNFFRSWSTNASASLVGGTTGHSLLMTTWAKIPDTEKDWDLQVKLQWKRGGVRDWNTSLTIHFDETACPSTDGTASGAANGSLPDPAQAMPSSG
jgi:hypothetical protein